MGEEEKKMEEKKSEVKSEESKPDVEEKKEEKVEKPIEVKKTEDVKEEAVSPAAAVVVTEIVLKVYMHCEGCARKVRWSLKGFEGVEDVITDCKSHKVIVKGEKADPLKVLDRVQRKSHRRVELISPIPKPVSEVEEKKEEEKEKPKPEVKKEEPRVITVVLKVYMHCEGCALEIKKRIQRMKGVESVEPDLKGSQVMVKGIFDPPKLVEEIYKKTGKQAVIVKQEPVEKKEEDKPKEGEKDKEKKGGEVEKKEGDNEAQPEAATEETKIVELKRNEYYYYPPRYGMELYAYPPQIFSDENPNACFVM